MRIPGVNFRELVARLGIQRAGWSFELSEPVQPVGVVFDATSLVPPLLPPTAFMGCQSAVPAANWGGLFRSLAPGGTYVRSLTVTSGGGASSQVCYALVDVPPVIGGAVSIATRFDMGPQPTVGIFEAGEAPGITLDPLLVPILRYASSNVRIPLIEQFFIPPGRFLYLEGRQVGVTYSVELVFSEVPVAPGAV